VARNWDPINMKNYAINFGKSLVLTCMASQVFAAGFQIQEQNATNLGLAYSGTAALAEDASMAFYNAAGLTRIENNQVVVSVVGLQGNFDFDATRSNVSLLPNTPVTGSNSDDPGAVVGIPSLHIAARINPKWMFGFSVASPFGLKTEYEETGIARYVATKSELKTINFSPSIAYQVLPCLSLALGGDVLWAKAELGAKIGNGTVAQDGFQKNSAEGWGYGYHGGLLWEPVQGTRLGLHYRSKVNLHAEGDSEQLSPVLLNYAVRTVRTEVSLPETAVFSFYHEFNPCWAITGDVAWTNWSRLDQLKLRFEPGAAPGIDTDTDLHFRDANRYALGAIFTLNTNWLFRAGVAYDETPVRDSHRTARIPDEDRVWLAFGGAYTFNKNLRVDMGYSHLFFSKASLNDNGPNAAMTTSPITLSNLTGEYDASANLLGIQMRYDFV
jgi:long-chain fatty acid transport protein